MPPTQERDLKAALDFTRTLVEMTDLVDLQRVVLPSLAGLLSADSVMYHALDLARPRQIDLIWPTRAFPPESFSGYAAVMPDHPLVTRLPQLRPSQVVRISDMLTPRAWRAHPAYQDSLSTWRIHDQMGLVLARGGPRFRAITLNRAGGVFTERDRDLLRLVQPHVSSAVERAARTGRPCPALEVVPAPRTVLLPATPPDADLSTRELQVLESISAGLTSAAAGRELGISARTVEKHLQNAYAKLGVSSRVGAVLRLGERTLR